MRLKALAEIYTMHSFAQLCNLMRTSSAPETVPCEYRSATMESSSLACLGRIFVASASIVVVTSRVGGHLGLVKLFSNFLLLVGEL